jgi:PAS domain S-box-containing protein
MGVLRMNRDRLEQQKYELRIKSLLATDERVRESLLIADAYVPGFPILYASANFEILTGYTQEEVRGRSCRFLQGPDTDPEAVRVMGRTLAERKSVTVDVLNYAKSGEPIWLRVHLYPMLTRDDRLVAYVGTQRSIRPDEVRPAHQWT